MNLFHVLWRTLFSLVVLFVLTKLSGARQVSNMSLFDYINGITIGSIAAEMAVNPDGNVLYPLLAMVIYGLSVFLVHFTECKMPKTRKILVGKPLILFQNDKFYRKNFKKASLSLDEFSAHLRTQGYFDLTGIRLVILEECGKLSAQPKETNRPTEVRDLGSQPADPPELVSVIQDGSVDPDGLRKIGKDSNWLSKKLKESGYSAEELFLAVGDTDGRFYAYPIENQEN
ncbi:MAG: DUF421 domain-containing protein [Eubacteriales bacterium]